MTDLSVLICAYGDYPQYSNRCVDSVVDEPRRKDSLHVHVGCNACGKETITHMRNLADDGQVTSLIACSENINKDPMMRCLVSLVKTPYFVWMDDDSHFKPGWLGKVLDYIATEGPFDCAGHIYFINRDRPEYARLVENRPWWTGMGTRTEQQTRQVHFATGGLFIARTDFFRENNFPDRNMVKLYDDILLGDLIQEKKGVLKDFKSVMGYCKISDGKRRGTGEDHSLALKRDELAGTEL